MISVSLMLVSSAENMWFYERLANKTPHSGGVT